MQSLRLGLCWTLSWNFYLHHPKIWQDFIQTLIWCCAGKSGSHFSSSFGRKTKTFLIFRKYTLIFYSIFAKTNCKLGESTKRTETDFGQSNPTKQSLLCLPLCWLHRMSIDSFCEQPSKDNKTVTILIADIFLASWDVCLLGGATQQTQHSSLSLVMVCQFWGNTTGQ